MHTIARRICTTLLAALLAGAWGVSLTACSTNPTTGRSQFAMLSRKQEIALGMKHKPQMIQEMGGEVAKAELRQYTSEVGNRLVQASFPEDPSLRELPWEFTLLSSDVVNAFALPGGKVFMSMGLARKMTNEAQFAAVLGHEIGHVAARHVSERYGQAMAGQLGLVGAGIIGELLGVKGVGNVLKQGSQIVELSLRGFGRDQELEADGLGVRYMSRTGYNPLGARQVMQILLQNHKGSKNDALSTHPHPESRIQQIDALMAGPYKNTQNNPEFSLREEEFRERFLRQSAMIDQTPDPRDQALMEWAETHVCTFAGRTHQH
jgi:predicted Zn-dependent protease